jgi:hypothetical protein
MISESDKDRARGHMGYLAVQQASTFVLGVPAAVQTQFVIEGAWSKILPSAEARFRRYLDRLDMIERQIEEDTENVAVDRIDEIELRADELTQLIKRYKHWQGNLSNLLGVPPNPFDARPMLGQGYNGAGSGINVPVTG